MSAWLTVALSLCLALPTAGFLLWWVWREASPSRRAARNGQEMIDVMVEGMEQVQQERRYAASQLQVVAGRSGLAGCPVCGKPWQETGVSHRFEIKDDVRRCWTP